MIYEYFNRIKRQIYFLYHSIFHENLEIHHVYKNNEILYFSFSDPNAAIDQKGEFLLINKNEEILIKCHIELEKQQISFDLTQISNLATGNWKIAYKNNNRIYFFQTIKEEIITKRISSVGKITDNKSTSLVSFIELASHHLSIYSNNKRDVIKRFPQLGKDNKLIQNKNLNIQSIKVEQGFLIIKLMKEDFDCLNTLKFYTRKEKENTKFYLLFTVKQTDGNVTVKIDLQQLFKQFYKNTRINLFAEEKNGHYSNERRITYYFKSNIEYKKKYYSIVFRDANFGLTSYVTKDNAISIYISEKSKLLSEAFSGRATLEKINNCSEGILTGVVKIESEEIYEVKSILVKHRKSMIDDSFQIPVNRINDSNKYSFTLDLNSVDFTQFYWDFFLHVKNENNLDIHLRIKNEKIKIKVALQMFEKKHTYFFQNQQYKIYPYITNSEELSLNYRVHGEYENSIYKKNERIAYFLYLTLGSFYKNKKIWLVHEKYSQTAQDNSYYFFKYCYENHYDKLVYYVIAKDSKDNKYLEPYQDRILYFMSIKHLFYLLTSNKIISSEAKGHGYAWRVSHGLIKPVLNQKRYIFLQHGVLGLKQIDNTFKANGINHADLFITSSDFEKEIVRKKFGYADSQILVSGLSRWDAPKNKKISEKKSIFFMPTWRNWLEEVSEDDFLKSDYFKEYSTFLQSKELAQVLNENRVELDFYLHPKFMPYVDLFSSVDSRINIIKYGEKTINQLVQDCFFLITDYSSIAWEAYYHNKSVLFYQFDRDEYMRLQGSYMNLETDLFGECAFNSVELIEKINDLSSQMYEDKNGYLLNNKKYLKYTDQHNSKRVYEGIINNEKNITSFDNLLYYFKKNIYFRTFWKKIKKRKLILTLKMLLHNYL